MCSQNGPKPEPCDGFIFQSVPSGAPRSVPMSAGLEWTGLSISLVGRRSWIRMMGLDERWYIVYS